MDRVTGFAPAEISESRDERVYRWQWDGSCLSARTRQIPGARDAELLIETGDVCRGGNYRIRWGEDSRLANAIPVAGSGVTTIHGLEQRGRQYCFSLYKITGDLEERMTPTFCIRTPIRYPYGRTFEENFSFLTHRPGQDTVIRYDLENFTTSDRLDPVRRRLGDTSAEGYLEHILRSVTSSGMTQMQKAVAIGRFLGSALQHNPIHLNLKESARAAAELEAKGWKEADIDQEAVWSMELGHTRCGFLNGFISAALLRRVGIRNEIFYGCGGHTTGKVWIGNEWYLWDIDAFKGTLPLDAEGNLPSLQWLAEGKHVFFLDTFPNWEDSNPDEGWTRSLDGRRITGYTGGGRYHSETGYGSSFIGGPKEYPPSVPCPLPVRKKSGGMVLLEWLGSYDRDGDFRDYVVELTDRITGAAVSSWSTGNTFVEVELPDNSRAYTWRVKARDHHARGSGFEDGIFYTWSVPGEIPAADVDCPASVWDLAHPMEFSGRQTAVTDREESDFIRLEGFEDKLGQTNYCLTELWKLRAGKYGKPVYRLVDETNAWFNGCHVRSLWYKKLDQPRLSQNGWHCTMILHIEKFGMAGSSRFPLIWAGRSRYHLGFGLIMDPANGLLHTGSNIFGDWRCGKSFEPCGWFRLDIEHPPGTRQVRYYLNGELLHIEDASPFREEIFDVDCVFVSSNPEAELDFMIADLWI